MHPIYYPSVPRDIAVDASGSIYLVTLAKEGTAGTGNSRWLIRKGLATSGGMTWSMVGDFSYPDGYDYDHGFEADGPTGVACVGSSVFVVGGGGKFVGGAQEQQRREHLAGRGHLPIWQES